jgi:hypothetical protein
MCVRTSGKIMERPQNFLCGSFIFPEFKLVMEGRNFDDIFTIKEQFQCACAKFKIRDLYRTCCIKFQKRTAFKGTAWSEGKCSYYGEKMECSSNQIIHCFTQFKYKVSINAHEEEESSVIVLYLYAYFRWPLGTKQAIWNRTVTFTHNISTAFKAHR